MAMQTPKLLNASQAGIPEVLASQRVYDYDNVPRTWTTTTPADPLEDGNQYKFELLCTPFSWKELVEGYLPGNPRRGKRSDENPM